MKVQEIGRIPLVVCQILLKSKTSMNCSFHMLNILLSIVLSLIYQIYALRQSGQILAFRFFCPLFSPILSPSNKRTTALCFANRIRYLRRKKDLGGIFI